MVVLRLYDTRTRTRTVVCFGIRRFLAHNSIFLIKAEATV